MMGAVVWLSCVVVLTAASAVISDYFDGETGSYVGCLISNGLCQEDEVCLDDGVFGMCQSHMPTKNYYRHHLNSEQTEELEGIVYQLVEHGYTWRHRYTQCMLGNILVSYREDVQFNPRYCERRTNKDERGGWDSEDYLPDGSPVLVKKLSDEYADLSTGGDYPVYDDYNPEMEVEKKEDELIENLGQDRELKQFIDNLSTDELKVLKKFLVNEKASHQVERRHPFSLESTPEKKAPVTITKVVVHYNPPNEDEKSNKNFDYNFDKEPSKSLSEENKLLSVTSIDEEKHEEYESEQPNGGFKDEKIGKTLEKSTVKAVQPIVIKTSTTARPLSKFNMFVTSLSPSGFKEAQRLEPIEQTQPRMVRNREKYWITMYVLCGTVAVIAMSAIFVYFARRQARFREKIAKWASSGKEQDNSTNEYQAKLTEKPEPLHKPSRAEAIATAEQTARTLSTGSSSTSSWTEEPVKPNMDISTGHIILSYMEDHMQNKDRLQKEWDSLCAYDAEPCSIVAAIEPTNMRKNRYTDILPYEHSRVKLNAANNVSGSDYINASTITDHDPRNPAYIATQGPLPHTVADFWQMVWEQGSVVMVDLTRLMENSVSMCHRYWPEEGTDLYHIYEVHLVSEHALCDDYVVRSFFLKNLQINETRTVTQFHFLTWPNNGIPNSIKTLLDFRRKVNKSYRGRSVPVIVHCSDGAGRTGTYCLIDMALNRLSKGAKEIDIAATLEHMRDQRFNMVRTKEQFEFALAAVAEEVHAIVNVPNPQP